MAIPPTRQPDVHPENPTQAPQDPLSDPEHKLGATPSPEDLARETELQRSGAASRSSAVNANTPGPNAAERDTTRDPDLERSTP